jgi:hypothetical protein
VVSGNAAATLANLINAIAKQDGAIRNLEIVSAIWTTRSRPHRVQNRAIGSVCR